MSFLIRRSLPWVWAGWEDTFGRSNESPIKQPWQTWGSATSATLTSNKLILPPVTGFNTGGVSYEFQPFSPHYGIEYDVWWPVSGLGEQALSLFIMQNWARVGVNWNNTLGVRLFYQPVGSGDTIRIQQWADLTSLSNDVAVGSSPVAFPGNTLRLQVLVDDDRFVRVSMNDTLVAAGTLLEQYATSYLRRGLNLMNQGNTNAEFSRAKTYDKQPSIPSDAVWTQVLYDDFNRSNGAVGNGSILIGTNAAIQSNSWSTTGTTNGSRGLLWNVGDTGGKMRVEATVGGNIGINNTAPGGIVLCSNTAGTHGLLADVVGNKLQIYRFTSALGDGNPTLASFGSITDGITVNTGDVVAYSIYNQNHWIEVNGVRKYYAAAGNFAVPASQPCGGLRVTRTSGTDSHSWNDIRIFTGV